MGFNMDVTMPFLPGGCANSHPWLGILPFEGDVLIPAMLFTAGPGLHWGIPLFQDAVLTAIPGFLWAPASPMPDHVFKIEEFCADKLSQAAHFNRL